MEKINNNFTKIISLVLAVILWIYVIYTENPASEIWVRGIPIVLQNVDVLNNKNLSLLDLSKETVDVKVRGKRLYLAKLEPRDFTAAVDLQNINKKGEAVLPVNIKSNVSNVEIIKKTLNTVTCQIEDIILREIPIEVKTSGEVSDGFVVSSIECEPKTVTVKVGESMANYIMAVTDEVNLQDASGNINTVKNVKIVDGSGNEVLVISKNLENVSVRIDMNYQKEVKVTADVINMDKNPHFDVEIAKITPQSVTIEGPISVVKDLQEIKLKQIDASAISEEEVEAVPDLPQDVKIVGQKKFTIKFNLKQK